jgi:hypothetical protein
MSTAVQDRLLIAIAAYIVDRTDETFLREFTPLMVTPELAARTIVSVAGGWAELARKEWHLRHFTIEEAAVQGSVEAAAMSAGELAQFNASRVCAVVMNGDIATGWGLARAAADAGGDHVHRLLVAVVGRFVTQYDRVQELKAVTS